VAAVAAVVGSGTRASTPGIVCCTAVRRYTAACYAVPMTIAVGRTTRNRCHNTHPWPVGRGSFQSPVFAARKIPVPGRPVCVQNVKKIDHLPYYYNMI